MLYIGLNESNFPEYRRREVVGQYVNQFEGIKSMFPDSMTEGEMFVCWMAMLNIHAISCIVSRDDGLEEWQK